MARITVEDCLTKQTNRFALIHLASKRTKQLLQGATVVLGEECDNKAVVTSLREIAEGKVRFLTPEEAERLKELNLEEQVPGLEPEAIEKRALEQKSIEEKFREASDQNGHSKTHAAIADDVLDDAALIDDEDDDEDEDEEESKEAKSEEQGAESADAGASNSSDNDSEEKAPAAEDEVSPEGEKKSDETF